MNMVLSSYRFDTAILIAFVVKVLCIEKENGLKTTLRGFKQMSKKDRKLKKHLKKIRKICRKRSTHECEELCILGKFCGNNFQLLPENWDIKSLKE